MFDERSVISYTRAKPPCSKQAQREVSSYRGRWSAIETVAYLAEKLATFIADRVAADTPRQRLPQRRIAHGIRGLGRSLWRGSNGTRHTEHPDDNDEQSASKQTEGAAVSTDEGREASSSWE